MSKVITFSRVYPAYHPRKGQQTDFVGKIWEGIYLQYPEWLGDHYEELKPLYSYIGLHGILPPKHHIIRAGHRWKVGDKFSPRVWSGKPYQSKQIIIAPDIEVKKVWDFEVYFEKTLQQKQVLKLKSGKANIPEIATNDGLNLIDFLHWFNKPFTGQIICWNENINY